MFSIYQDWLTWFLDIWSWYCRVSSPWACLQQWHSQSTQAAIFQSTKVCRATWAAVFCLFICSCPVSSSLNSCFVFIPTCLIKVVQFICSVHLHRILHHLYLHSELYTPVLWAFLWEHLPDCGRCHWWTSDVVEQCRWCYLLTSPYVCSR